MAKKSKISSKALKIGRDIAAEALARRQKAAKTRKVALDKATKRVTRTVATSGTKAMIAKDTVTHQSAGVLIAEGDSWFDYPFHDVLSDLEDMFGFDVESVAHHGDTVEDMAYSGGQLDDFSRRVEKVLRTGVKPRAILLSGGGNDVAGDEFAMLLNHALSSISGLNESIVNGVIEERVRDAYVTILSAITQICKNQIGDAVPIVIHGYDYPVPDGRGFLGGFGPLPGPWLEPGFRQKGYDDMTVCKNICVDLINQFNSMLDQLAGQSPFAHVHYLDLRKTLSTGPDFKKDWANELHPTGDGFKKVTAKFAALIQKL
jgi:lysophospholipase L1-like esterase